MSKRSSNLFSRPPLPADRDAAIAVWGQLNLKDQRTLVREVVRTQGQGLRQAYSQLRAIGCGTKVFGDDRRAAASGDIKPCVTFVVPRKIKKISPDRALPAYLYTHLDPGQGAQLCAVPTDVRAYEKLQTHANPSIIASCSGYNELEGRACAVVQYGGGPLYLLGCHHVFAYSDICSALPGQVDLYTSSQPRAPIGTLSSYLGGIRAGGYFFDAALAYVSDLAILNQLVVAPLSGFPVVQSEMELAHAYTIQTPRRGIVIEANWLAIHYDYFAPEYGALQNVILPVVVELHTMNGPSRAGDSGSPVFDATGTVFQGMHIAGNDGGSAFFIPAYELLRASNYSFTADDQEMLQLV